MTGFFGDKLLKEVDGFGLGLFRAIFGAFMVFEIGYFQRQRFVKDGILNPIGTFEYDLFAWVQPLPESLMNLVVMFLMLSAICIMLGILFRPATIIFTVLFSYFLFLGKGHYNNHFYLFCLISFYLIFTKADRNFSLKSNKNDEDKARFVPLWNYQVLRIQLVIAYFFGGLAKLNPDWLYCQQPMTTLAHNSYAGTLIDTPTMIAFLNYGGVAFDLFIGFLLLYKPTRLIAVFGVLVFNLLNGLVLFNDIGIFPFVMICSTILFFDPEGKWIEKIRAKFISDPLSRKQENKEPVFTYATSSIALKFLMVFLVIQLVLPFRYLALPSDANWTGIGQKFSWRMKMQTREIVELKMMATNKATGEKAQVPIGKFANPLQIRYMAEQPVMIWQFAQYLRAKNIRDTKQDIEIYCRMKVTYNGREAQYVVDPDVDLTSVEYSPFQINEWMMPLENDCK